MFVSHEKSSIKKIYQKPNILRKKPCMSAVRPNITDIESPTNTTSVIHYAKLAPQPSTEGIKLEHVNPCHQKIIQKQELAIDTLPGSPVSDLNLDTRNIFDSNQINNQEFVEQASLNIESFLNGAKKQLKLSPKEESGADVHWCLGFDDSKEIVLSSYDGSQSCKEDQKRDLMLGGGVPSNVVSSLHPENKISQDIFPTEAHAQNVTIDCNASRAIKFKCDEPNCGKGFWSELKLKNHKNAHNKQTRARAVQQIAECPVKKINADGIEERCGRTFLVREHLSKHLNDDHTPEDALYRCSACARRFFWAAGLRAHRQAQCARGALSCAWPGCGKQFRQPCRLREHARAHTGDRPYACPFPECGWSFRSASKLQRHARRHTGERRHVCSACGRAFLRREHLREHCARCHPPHDSTADARTARAVRTARTTRRARARAPALTSAGDDSVIDPSTTTVDPKYESGACAGIETVPVRPRDNMFVLSLVPEVKVEIPGGEMKIAECVEKTEECEECGQCGESGEYGECGECGECEECGEGAECHAARTHCTWPLTRRHAPHAPHALYEQLHTAYVLDEDTPADQSEPSENNIYTIRSDLFLHGNVLINEDSEFIVSRHDGESGESAERGEGVGVSVTGRGGSAAGRGGGGVPSAVGGGRGEGGGGGGGEGVLDAGLDYIDVHPTIDLMPEELMYADAAVDESSFRVLLLNGDELT